MGNKVVGIAIDNHSQLVFPRKALCASSPRSPLPLSPWAAYPFAPLVSTQAAAQDEEHTSIGGYGEVHYHNLSGPESPGQVNVARFVVFLSHSFNERLSFRSELEVEDAKVEGGEPGR